LGGGGGVEGAAYQTTGDIKEIEKQLCSVIAPYLNKNSQKEEIIF